MKNKALLFHAFSLALFLVGCGFFYIVGGGTNTEIAQEKQTADINIIPDPIESESETHEKTKMELFEEYQHEQQRKEAEEKAQQDFNSLSFFTGSSSSYTEEDTIASEQQETVLSKEEEIEILNKIGNEKKVISPTAKKTVSNASITTSTDISFEEKEKKESIEEKIQRQKKEQMYAKKKRIAEKTGIDITEPSEAPQQVASAPVAETKSQNQPTKKSKGFRTMGAEATSGDNSSIRAVIHGEQKNITTASQVKLRLLDNVKVNPNLTIPKNTMVYAKASFSSNRIHLNIESIAYNNNVYPFNAQIYDLDGFEGLYVPDNVVSDAGKETSSNTVSGTSIGITPSQRALSNVITNTTAAIKNATSNKIRETKVTLPANYKLIIKQKD